MDTAKGCEGDPEVWYRVAAASVCLARKAIETREETPMDLKALVELPPWEWPEDTADQLLEIVRDTKADETVRLVAAELAGEVSVINDEVAEALLAIARTPSETEMLRLRSLYSLGPAIEYADIDGFEDADEVAISEETFNRVMGALRGLYEDKEIPESVRRAALEASVRAPQDWHSDAIRQAYLSDDGHWRLAAVFCMGFVSGFKDEILQALHSGDEDLEYEAIIAAGNWELDEAWSHIAGLVASKETDKYLLMAAIEAVATIRPQEAEKTLAHLLVSLDEDIVEAAHEAISMAEEYSAADAEDDDEDSLK